MKKPNPIMLAALGLALAGSLHAQEPRPQADLTRVRATFGQADANKDGVLDASEIKAIGIPEADFRSQDADKNSRLSGDEFVTYYRLLLVRAGRTVAKDIETEVARIQAARRTQEAKDAAKDKDGKDAAEKDSKPARGPAAGRRSTEERLRRAKAALDGKRNDVRVKRTEAESGQTTAERVQAARDKQTAERVQAARDATQAPGMTPEERAAKLRDERAAERIEAARDAAQAPAMTPEQRAAKLRDEKAASDAQRAADMRARQAAQKDGEPAPKPAAKPPVGETPERRAAQYVKRLVDAGRLSPESARDFYAVLSAAPEAADQNPPAPADLREALGRAKPRIGELVQKGFLTAEEGRELSSAMDARATAAAKDAPGVEDVSKRRESGGEEQGGPADARRAKQARDGQPSGTPGGAREEARPRDTKDAEPQRAPETKPKRDAVKPKGELERKPQDAPVRKPKGEPERKPKGEPVRKPKGGAKRDGA